MEFSRELRQLLLGTMIVLGLIASAASYWALVGRESLLAREDNPRQFEALARIQRGSIYDRNDKLLVETVAVDSGLKRHYRDPASYSIVGYYSLRYGVAGAEAAFNDILAGAQASQSLEDYFKQEILRMPPVGSDIKLTLDADIQGALVRAMGEQAGAAVVMDVERRDLLVLASLPSYDPNTLEEDWGELIEAAGDPFFNRALQGYYQLGSAMYTIWLAEAIAEDFDLGLLFEGATAPVDLGEGMVIGCVLEPNRTRLTLVEAYIYGCPTAFQAYQRRKSEARYEVLARAYSFDDPIILSRFPLPEPLELPLVAEGDGLDPDAWEDRNALGQGGLTTTALHLAAVMTAIAREGDAIAPRILSAERGPASEDWLAAAEESNTISMMSGSTASQLRGILRESWSVMQQQALPAGVEIGAQVGRSRSGEGSQIWLSGYVRPAERNPVAFVLLFEDSDDVAHLISVGQVLAQALSSQG